MNKLWQNISLKMLGSGSKLYLLIAINVIIFLLSFLMMPFANVNGFITSHLQLPAYLPRLLTHFWTPFTYLFIHNNNLFQVIFNMLWLYWMGQLFEDNLGKKRTLGLYILGGLTGAALYIICFNFIPVFTQSHALALSSVAGTPACVMAIVVATCTLLPYHEVSLIFITVKLKWLVLIYLALILIYTVSNISNGGGLAAGDGIVQMGGALFGFLYIKQLQKGSDWIAGISNLFKSRSRLRIVVKNPLKKASSLRPRQDEVDLILDKISKVGYENLSTEEKEILFRASKNES